MVGFCKDKEWQEALAQWAPLAGRIWAVPVRNPRTLDPDAIVAEVAGDGIPAQARPDVAAAFAAALEAGAERILVAGSLFLAGEARAFLTGMALEEIRGSQ